MCTTAKVTWQWWSGPGDQWWCAGFLSNSPSSLLASVNATDYLAVTCNDDTEQYAGQPVDQHGQGTGVSD
jgi:hypothetical protein